MPESLNDQNDFSKPTAWRSEVQRSRTLAEQYHADWEASLGYYLGADPNANDSAAPKTTDVNVMADFYNTELKVAQLFYDTPNLSLSSKGEFHAPAPAGPAPMAPQPAPQPPDPMPIIAAHRELLNELLGADNADALTTVQKAIKDCLLTSGFGATKISYEAATMPVPQEDGTEVPLPVDEQWRWDRIPSKKLRIPADFKDNDLDEAPWLAMDFRMPKTVAERLLNLPADYTATKDRDTGVLEPKPGETAGKDYTEIPYVDGTEIWYRAYIFDGDVINPQVIRRHVLVEGVDTFVEKSPENPYQTLLPNGRLSADSMRGYPIHVLYLRDVPDSPFTPSDSKQARPLIRELCTFRSQQVQERDANLPRFLYDSSKLQPGTVEKIINGEIGAMIPVEEGVLDGGPERIIAQVSQGTQTRGSYTANDYIQRDLDKTTGLDATAAGVKDEKSATATEIATVDRQRNVRLDSERRRVLNWYLKGVQKFSALVCRFMTPQLAVPYVGTQHAQAWAQWDKKTWDGRFVFEAKPDSQIKLDAAAERKFALDLYQFLAKDPNIDRKLLLRNLLEKANLDATQIIVNPQPKPPAEPSLSFAFKGEDFLAPQAMQVRELLAQMGFQISQEAISGGATQLLQQMLLGVRDADGKPVKATQQQPEHGGTADQVRPLSKQKSDQSGQRPGPGPTQ